MNDWARDNVAAYLAGMRHTAKLIHDLAGLSQFAVELVLERLRSNRGSLMVLDRNRELLRITAARGLPDWVVEKTAVRLGEGIAGRVASLGRPMLVATEAPNPQHPNDTRYRSGTYISAPVPGEMRVMGVVNVTDPVHESPFEPRDLEELLNITESLGLALQRAVRFREAEELVVRDELTGLHNRRYFFEFLEAILERARQEAFPVTLLLFDIDHFKQYNDQFGHPSGDEVLREVADLMRTNFRAHDVICRLGGEEFAVILWDGRSQSGGHWQGCPKTAYEFAERLRQATMVHRFRGVNRVGITLSGGLATFPWDGNVSGELMERADQALYRAKRDGRNRVYLCQ